MNKNRKKHLSTFQIIILGFLIMILSGALLLMLPFATKDGQGASFLDALFTATSASCVTGLIVQDTATYWSAFGKFIIILLIQIGGMGVVTMTVAITMLSGRKIGLMQRSTMQEAIAAPTMGGIVRMTGFILKMVALVELLGALAMLPVFAKEFGMIKGIGYSLFHSISAFCNAGFDLMGVKEKFSSLTDYPANPVINLTIMTLIVVGGIGFTTWSDIKTKKLNIKKYRMQSKVVLVVTAILIVFPALFFYFYDFSMEKWDGISTGEKIWSALFMSVTTRTAGFNTIDLTALSEPGLAVTIILMLIGGSPGSTAGGLKTTTIAVIFITAISVFRRKEDANCFGRRIAEDTVKYAATIFFMYLVLCLFGGIAISCLEGLPLLTCIFETASAIGTVGLTLGVTPGLGTVSRVILIVLMYFGRVGGLTLVFAAISGIHANVSRLPQEKITVG